jgi:zinc/manganese transport system permease protein
VTKRIGWAIAVACLTGVVATVLGVLLAYDSYDWSARHAAWPVSFFIVILIFLAYLVTELPVVSRAANRRPAVEPSAVAPSLIDVR